MTIVDALTALRDALVALYPTEGSARVVASEAGLPTAWIDFSGAAVAYWQSILTVATHTRQMPALLDAARRHFPENEQLLAAVNAWQGAATDSSAGADPASPVPTRGVQIHVGGENYGIVAGGDVKQASIDIHGRAQGAQPRAKA